MIYFILNVKTFISPKFTQVYRSLPQFTSVYLSLPPVYLSLPKYHARVFIKQKKITKEIFRVFESFQFNPNIFKQKKNLSIPKFHNFTPVYLCFSQVYPVYPSLPILGHVCLHFTFVYISLPQLPKFIQVCPNYLSLPEIT